MNEAEIEQKIEDLYAALKQNDTWRHYTLEEIDNLEIKLELIKNTNKNNP